MSPFLLLPPSCVPPPPPPQAAAKSAKGLCEMLYKFFHLT